MRNLKSATYLNLTKHDFSLQILVHSNNVASIALKMAEEMKLCPMEKQQLYEGALYHDIGKSKIPESILYKKGRLEPQEWDVMKKHAIYSQELYLNTEVYDSNAREIAKVIRHHHENWDGTGYPDQLAAEDIPFHSRIIKIADIFEAMTQPRTYRPFKIQNALEIMEQMMGKQIDPYIFDKSYDILYKLLIQNLKGDISTKEGRNIFNG